jgi:hypothetical protein
MKGKHQNPNFKIQETSFKMPVLQTIIANAGPIS